MPRGEKTAGNVWAGVVPIFPSRQGRSFAGPGLVWSLPIGGLARWFGSLPHTSLCRASFFLAAGSVAQVWHQHIQTSILGVTPVPREGLCHGTGLTPAYRWAFSLGLPLLAIPSAPADAFGLPWLGAVLDWARYSLRGFVPCLRRFFLFACCLACLPGFLAFVLAHIDGADGGDAEPGPYGFRQAQARRQGFGTPAQCFGGDGIELCASPLRRASTVPTGSAEAVTRDRWSPPSMARWCAP